MANNYCQAAELYKLTPKQVQLAADLCAIICEFSLEGGAPHKDMPIEEFAEEFQPLAKMYFGLTDEQRKTISEVADFGYVEYEVGEQDGTPILWLGGEEYTNIDGILAVLKLTLEITEDYDTVCTLTWADWCSKPRSGEFGGGCAAVSAKEIRVNNTWDMAQELAEQIKAKSDGSWLLQEK